MILYHGSYTKVETPDLKHSRNNVDFGAGHSVIFKSYIYDSSGTIIGIKYYDYVGIGRSFNESDKFTKLMQSANLKDEK